MESGVAPEDERESAILEYLKPGAYTALVDGVSGSTGTVVLEIYDPEESAGTRLVAVSAEGRIDLDNDALITGQVISGRAGRKVLIRALGPSSHVADTLRAPSLELRNADGALLASNDYWGDTQEAEISAAKVSAPLGTEAAIVRVLQPGAYTAVLRGFHGSAGVARIEIRSLR